MAIHLPIPMQPFGADKNLWKLYFKMQVKAGEAYYAYSDTLSILGLFSIKKRKIFNKALNDFHISREKYLTATELEYHENF